MKNVFLIRRKSFVWALLSLVVFVSASSFSFLGENPDAIVGVWKTGEGNAMVKLLQQGN